MGVHLHERGSGRINAALQPDVRRATRLVKDRAARHCLPSEKRTQVLAPACPARALYIAAHRAATAANDAGAPCE